LGATRGPVTGAVVKGKAEPTVIRQKITRAAKEYVCVKCGGIIPRRDEFIMITRTRNPYIRRTMVYTEVIGRRHIDCPVTESMIKSVIDEALAEHGYHDPRTHSLESSVARDVAVTVINLMLHSDSK
jgi:hypothetical protein